MMNDIDIAALRSEIQILRTKIMALENEQRNLDMRVGLAEATIELIKRVKVMVPKD